MNEVFQDEEGMWCVKGTWGTLGHRYVRREAAEAVAALPEPDPELLLAEIEYWRTLHRKLIKAGRKAWKKNSWEHLLATHYGQTLGTPGSPMERRSMSASFRGHFGRD